MYFFIRNLFLFIIFSFLAQHSYAGELLQIEITGIKGDTLKNTQDQLTIEKSNYGKNLNQSDIQSFYQAAPNAIQDALKPFGYFKATVHPTLTHQGSVWTARFYIHPGPTLHITALDIKVEGPGKGNSVIKAFIDHFPLKVGNILLTQAYEDAKTAFFRVVNNEGYLKAILIKKELQINLAKQTAVVILHINTGQQYYFGEFSFFSKNTFAPDFLRRFAQFHPDEPFSSQKVLKFQENLTNSRYFKEVIVTPKLDKVTDFRVPTDVEVKPYKAKQYKLGAGYGTFTGPRLLAGVEWRHIGDSGQHFSALAKLSATIKGLAAKYFIPGSNPLTDQYTVGANIQQLNTQNGDSFSESISGGYVKMQGEWQHSLSLNLLNERYNFNNQPSQHSHQLYPAYSLSNIVSDNPIDTRRGRMINFILQGSSEKIFSTTSFIQSEIKAKFIFSPTVPSRVILRGDLGYTVVNDINQLPLTLQYLAGGPGSVRGYNYGSIGPGRYLETVSAEYQHRLIDKVYGALFYDMGTATNQFNQGFQRGDGIGFVYASPIGAIQVYLARAESIPSKPKSIIFNIGTDF